MYRRAGDDYLLVEYGPPTLDLALRLRAHALQEALAARALPGVIDLTAGIRSLQIHHDPRRLPTAALLRTLQALEADLPRAESLRIPSRIVHLPLSWEDPATLEAIEKYQRVVRADAPWCPSNIEFIRRINGLASVDEVRRIVFDASFLVLGLGDVYLGAPVATPIDPRHRLVTTKYNPARTWTPENAVGIGGAYLCIYGMEGPGGYQFVGRTVQVWNTHRQVAPFREGKPWLLRPFDRIRFFPVEADELLAMRAGFLHGRTPIRIEETTFDFSATQRRLAGRRARSPPSSSRQQAAFLAERERWAAAGKELEAGDPVDADTPPPDAAALPPGCVPVLSPVAGNLWKILKAPGDPVAEGDPVAIVEAMKTEISVTATGSGIVREIRAATGRPVQPGQILVVLQEPDCGGPFNVREKRLKRRSGTLGTVAEATPGEPARRGTSAEDERIEHGRRQGCRLRSGRARAAVRRPGAHRAGHHRHAAGLPRAGRLRRGAGQRGARGCRRRSSPARRCWSWLAARGMLVIHTREGHRPDLSDAPPAKVERGAPSKRIGDPGPMGRILIRGEPGTTSSPSCTRRPGEPVIDKPGKGSFYATDLHAILQNRGIET